MPRINRTVFDKFAAIYGELVAISPSYEKVLQQRELKIARKTGLNPHWSLRTEEEANRHMEAMSEVDLEIGFDEINDKLTAIYDRLDPLIRVIIETPAGDLPDLALKANAIASMRTDLWDSALDDLEYEDMLIRDLIENVCGVAGVDLQQKKIAHPGSHLN